MGSSCCIPAATNVEYMGDTLPYGIEHLDPRKPVDPTIHEEFINVIATSFCGTTTTSPEAIISWSYSVDSSGIEPAKPLTNEPSPERQAYFKWVGGYIFHAGFRHGGCFALREAGKLVAVTVLMYVAEGTTPYKQSMCEFMSIAGKLGGMSNVPEEIGNPRNAALDGLFANTHADAMGNKRHLYVFAVATVPGEQGKGYGRRLMELVGKCADNLG